MASAVRSRRPEQRGRRPRQAVGSSMRRDRREATSANRGCVRENCVRRRTDRPKALTTLNRDARS